MRSCVAACSWKSHHDTFICNVLTADPNQSAWQCPSWWPRVMWVETLVLFFAVCRQKFTKISKQVREWSQFATPFSIWRYVASFRKHSRSSREIASTFKFCLLKIQEICPLKRFLFPLNAPKCVWWPVAGLHPNPLGELTALQRSPDWQTP